MKPREDVPGMSKTAGTALLGALLCTMALMAAAPAAQAAGKPDLVIAGYAVHGSRYAFQGEHGGSSPDDVTKNRGAASAGSSLTRAYLVRGTGANFSERLLATRAVPGIGPGKQNAGDASTAANVNNYPVGGYRIELCADATHQVQESNETNNCALIRTAVLDPINVYVIRRAWTGTLSGVAQLGAIVEQYKSNNAKLVFDKPLDIDHGLFFYDFAGPVTYTDSGSGGGCTYSGGDTQTFGPGGASPSDDLVIDYLQRRYTGSADVDGSFYTIRVKCGSTTGSLPGPVNPIFLSIPQTTSFPFGATKLAGSASGPSQNWVWDFH